MKKLLLGLSLVGLLMHASGQSYFISYYENAGNPGGLNTNSYSTSTGWTEISSGGQNANEWTAPVAIPFPFDFYGDPVTHFKVSMNGVLTFDTATTLIPGDNASLPSATLPDSSIAFFWDAFTTSPPLSTLDDIDVKTFGTSPNRQFWVRYAGFELNGNTNLWSAIVLEETTNKIYVVDLYSSNASGLSATVGLQQSSSLGQDVGANLTVSGNSTSTTTNDYYEFLFVPAGTCVPPGDFQISDFTSTTVTLSWNEAASGSTFDVEYGLQGFAPGSGQTITGITDTFRVVTGLTAYEDYDFYVTENCTGGTASPATGPISILTAMGSGSKEDFSGTFAPGGWYESQGDIANPTSFTSSTSAGWTTDDFANAGSRSAKELISGSTNDEWLISHSIYLPVGHSLNVEFDLAITRNSSTVVGELASDDSVMVVISTDDGLTWNRSDALLVIDENSAIASGTGIHYTLPLSAYTGLVRVGFYSESRTTNASNEVFVDNVTIRPVQTCVQPNNFTATSVGSSTVDLSWTGSGNYELIWGPPGFDQATATAVSVTGNTYTATGLFPYFGYEFYIWQDCGGSNSDTVGPLSLITAVLPAWIEDFEGASFAPFGWEERSAKIGSPTVFTSFSSAVWARDDFGNDASLSESARILVSGTTSSYDDWLLTPLIDLGTGNSYQLEFDAAMTSSGSTTQQSIDADDSLNVVISTDAGLTWTRTNNIFSVQTANSPLNTGTHYVVDLSSYSGVVRLAFYWESTVSGGTSKELFVDNVEVRTIPNCPSPFSLLATGASDSVTISWTVPAASAPYTIEYGLNGFALGSGTQITGVLDTFATINSLLPQNTYQFYVMADCGANGTSAFSSPVSYTTPCAPLIAPFVESFDNWTNGTGTATTGDSISACWSRSPDATNVYSWRVRTGTTPSSNTGPSGDRGGSGNYVFAEASSSGAPARLTLDAVDVSALTTPEVVLYYHMYGADMGSFSLEISDGVNTYSNIGTISQAQQSASADPYLQAIYNLAPFNLVSDTISISLVAVRGSDFEADIAIDDFEVREAQTCPTPSQLTLVNLTSNSASIGWTTGSGISNLEWGPQGFQQGSGVGNMVKNAGSPYNITSLTPNTTYDVYIQDSCTLFPNSVWIGPFTFTTQCAVVLNGSYTVGGPVGPTNFPTLDSAIRVLNDCGVSGPTEFNVQSGTYSGAFLIDTIKGASSTNTVTFRGDDATNTIITHDGSVREATIVIQNGDHLIFKELTIQNTKAATDMWGILLRDQADSILIDSCRFIMAQAALSDAAHIMAGSSLTSGSAFTSGANNARSLMVSNSYFEGGADGIRILGDDPLYLPDFKFMNNEFVGQDDYAMYVYDAQDIEVAGNIVRNARGTGTDGFYGNDIGNFNIHDNEFDVTGDGIYIIDGNDVSFTTTSNSTIYNNILRSLDDEPLYLNDVEHVDVDFNTCYTESSNAIRVNDFNNFNVRNNIFYSIRGFAFNSDDNLPTTGNSLDYNIYYPYSLSNRNPYFLSFEDGTSNYSSLADWQAAKTAFNVNSLEGDPQFISTTNLRLEGFLADGNGLAIAGISTDIDGDARAGSPDIGADEFNPAACPIPTSLGVANVTSSSADLNWSGNGTAYEVEWGSFGFAIGSGTQVSVATNTTSIASLSGGITYQYYVRNDCNPNPSSWAGPYTFITACGGALSGTYTVDPAQPASATNYTSVASIATALSVCGVSGPVEVNIAAATFNETVLMDDVPGASSTNTIVFKGSGKASTVISSDGRDVSGIQATVLLDSTDFVTFRDLTIQNTATAEGWGVQLIHTADHNNFIKVRFDMQPTSSADVAGLIASNSFTSDNTTGDNASDLLIDSCHFSGGEKAVVINGTSSGFNVKDIQISNSLLEGMDETGIDINEIDTLRILNDTIRNIGDAASSFGIEIDDTRNFIVSANYIIASDEGISIDDGNDAHNPSTRSEFSNNMIIAGSDHAADIIDVTHINIYHNSLVGEPAIEIDDHDAMDIRNNIFYGRGSEAFLSADLLGSLSRVDIDYNLYYGSDTTSTYPIDIDGTDYATLADWVAADNTRNANSIEGDPDFFDLPANDLHMTRPIADGVGDNAAGVIVDIDGDTRPLAGSTIVDIGADEYIPFTCFRPDSLRAVIITPTSMDLEWSSGGATAWQVLYGLEGFAPGTGTLVGTTTKPYTVGALTPATCYEFYVRDSCGVGDVSMWYGPYFQCTDYNCNITTTPAALGGDTVLCEARIDTLFGTTNDDLLVWLDANGFIVHQGDTLITDTLRTDTTIYAADAGFDGPQNRHVGALTNIAPAGFGNFSNGMMFTAMKNIRIDSVTMRSDGPRSGTINIWEPSTITNANIDVSQAILVQSIPYDMPAAGEFQLPVEAVVAPGQYFINLTYDAGTGAMFRSTTGAQFPYVLDNLISIDSSVGASNFPSTRIYYFFDWVVSGMCVGSTDSLEIKFGGTPTASFTSTIVNVGGTDATVDFDASASASGITDYIWDFGDGNLGTGITPQHVYTADGTYTVQLVVVTACDSDTITQQVVIQGINLEENALSRSIALYPNPTKDEIRIDFDSQGQQTAILRLFDLSGRQIKMLELDGLNGEFSLSMNLSDLADGVYMLSLSAGDLKASKRVIKQ